MSSDKGYAEQKQIDDAKESQIVIEFKHPVILTEFLRISKIFLTAKLLYTTINFFWYNA